MIWKKKLIYQSWHRGTKEADVLLGPFADQYIPQFDEEQLIQYQDIIETPDQELVPILYGQSSIQLEDQSEVMKMLIDFVNARAKK